jgi:hypothetical protein
MPSFPQRLRPWLGTSRLTVPLLMPVCAWGLGAPRGRTLRTLGPMVLGLGALGVLGWRAAQVRGAAPQGPAPRRRADGKQPFRFTWQMPEEFAASAASGH